MPTGYTAPVADGEITTLRDFALRVAKAFLVHERDKSINSPISYAVVADFYEEWRVKAAKDLNDWMAMNEQDRHKLYDEEHKALVVSTKQLGEGDSVKRERYEAMIQKVKDWKAPTPVHETGIKRYMLQQLEESLGWDCPDRTGEHSQAKPRPDFEEWCKLREERLRDEVVYYENKLKEERESVARTNQWIDDLVKSIGDE